jgi:hypothetical protein
MLSIGRALMSRPKLLLLDEPSLGLAPLIVKQIFSVIRGNQPQQEGMTDLPGRAERLPRAEARPSRLRAGQWPGDAVRHRAGASGQQARCARPISKAGIGLVSWRATRADQMVHQYWWLYQRTGPLTWAERPVPLSSPPEKPR